MASASFNFAILLLLALLILAPAPVSAFGAGNIASISKIEGTNWRHGDIEDMLRTIAFIKGHKWTSMAIKRVYFGNWLRDYSQAVDVGTLKGVQADTIRILVWILAFLSFGYATAEFEVTNERLGTYRPEEHIDNPKDYAENQDARKYDPRLRPPVDPIELAIDPETGMKNYIANESGGWATSSGYVKHSLTRAIHFGRVFTSGAHGTRGKEEDLCEALRCLGQALHTLEDFGAHTNYVELALREMGFNGIFTHTGTQTEVTVRGKRIYPLVTGTFGGVDFLHSVLGEVTDHVTQSEVDEVNTALQDAATSSKRAAEPSSLDGLVDILGKVPGTGHYVSEARQLQTVSDAQTALNKRESNQGFSDPSATDERPIGIPNLANAAANIDPQAVIQKIYPILLFRDQVVRGINTVIAKIPGLEHLIEVITERVTLFVLSLLAPFVIPVINAASAGLKTGSSGVIAASARQQYEPWTDPRCTDPTHSLLSKDHFSNVLNEPAGLVATVILQYVAPRVIFAWEHPDIDVQQVLDDACRVFHHPALRNAGLEIHRNMYAQVEQWVQRRPDRGADLNRVLSSESVRAGKNQRGIDGPHAHGVGAQQQQQQQQQQQSSTGGFAIPGLPGIANLPSFLGGSSRGLSGSETASGSLSGMPSAQRDQPESDDTSSPAAAASALLYLASDPYPVAGSASAYQSRPYAASSPGPYNPAPYAAPQQPSPYAHNPGQSFGAASQPIRDYQGPVPQSELALEQGGYYGARGEREEDEDQWRSGQRQYGGSERDGRK